LFEGRIEEIDYLRREDVAAVSVAAAALVAIGVGGEAGEWSGGAPVRAWG
jgi:hypothetical protein